MSIQKEDGAFTTVLTTELNSLVNGAASVLSAAQTDIAYTHGDFEYLYHLATPATNLLLLADLFIIRQPNGTDETVVTGASEVFPPGTYVGTFIAGGTADPGRAVIRDVELPVGTWKVALLNTSGFALDASASTVGYLPWRFADL